MNNKIIQFLIVTIIVAGTLGAVFAYKDANNKNDAASTNNPLQNQDSENQNNVLGASTQNITPKNEFKKISAKEADVLIKSKNENEILQIIDIRTEEEFKSGNINGSINIDFDKNFESNISKLDKNHAYLIYCQSGHRSDEAMKFFDKLEFEKVYELSGGVNAWPTQ